MPNFTFISNISTLKTTQLTLTASEFYLKLKSNIKVSTQDTQTNKLNTLAFCAGSFTNGSRKAQDLLSRSCITLDIDSGTDDTVAHLKTVLSTYKYIIYSTFSHNPPTTYKYRLVLFLKTPISPSDYKISVQSLLEGELKAIISQIDISTDQPARFMFAIHHLKERDLYMTANLSEDLNYYAPIQNPQRIALSHIQSAGDPREKPGWIGAFNRVFNVPKVVDALLPHIYKQETSERYSYREAESVGGVVLYDNDQYVYSNHSTDPAFARLCSAFDLVRIHKFAKFDKDDSINKSTSQMLEYAQTIPKVRTEYMNVFNASSTNDPDAWLDRLHRTVKGQVKHLTYNCALILSNTHKIKYDTFTNQLYVDDNVITDVGITDLKIEMTQQFSIEFTTDKILESLHQVSDKYSSLIDMLDALPQWDNTERLPTLFQAFFNAEDTHLNRQTAELLFVAAIARAYKPGTVFPYLPVLKGNQGCGKSQFCRLIALQEHFHAPYSFDLRDRDAVTRTWGKWILEIEEMSGYRKADLDKMKAFISDTKFHQYRHVFCKTPIDMPRQFVCIATTNESEFLRDYTGNRRFIIIECKTKVLNQELRSEFVQKVPQLWAEALYKYKQNPHKVLQLDEKAQAEQEKTNDKQTIVDSIEHHLLKFLTEPALVNRYDTNEDLLTSDDTRIEPRTRVCTDELIAALDIKDKYNNAISQRIRRVMLKLGWKKYRSRFGRYGRQFGYSRD